MVRYAILGPVEVWDGVGRRVDVGGVLVRALVARLALAAGRVVAVDVLVDDLWGNAPPANAANALQALVSRLRRVLPDAPSPRVESQPGGYRLAIDGGAAGGAGRAGDPAGAGDGAGAVDVVDAVRFESLAGAGARALGAGDPGRAAGVLGEALALWRGPPLADVQAVPYVPAVSARLEERRLAAVEDHAEAALALGRHRDVAADLADAYAAHPLRERLAIAYMRALHGCGRQADALAVYGETRRLLADELGVDPGADLAAAHLSILRGEPSTAAPSMPPRSSPIPTPQPSPTMPQSPTLPPSPMSAAGPAAPSGPGAPDAGPGWDGHRRIRRPAALTSFIGREGEVTTVAGMVAGGRLVTVVGPGGAGKTRLVRELAHRVEDSDDSEAPAHVAHVARIAALVPDGIALVELAPVRDPLEVPLAVLSALGGRDVALLERPGGGPSGRARDVSARLLSRLADARLLLIVDNCEHLVGAAARLVEDVLAGCPGVRVLATSREPLGVPGELLAPLPPLALPAPDANPAEALACPSVRLFADRAAAVRPGFAVDARSVAAAVQICRRLDGMPLAIELAAARLRSFAVGEVAARLDDRFRLLVAGSRTALPRHQTLRAVVDWSWELLDDAERALARRLSVFPGVVTLEAAESVCAGDPLGREDVIPTLASLVDKSLLELVDDTTQAHGGATVGASVEGGAGYRMLETIRVYCGERLLASADHQATRDAFVRRALALVEQQEPLLRTRAQLGAIERLTREHDNVVMAVRYAADAGQAQRAVHLATGMSWLGSTRGAHAETMALLEEALAVPGEVEAADRALAHLFLGMTQSIARGFHDGRASLERAVALMPPDALASHPMLALAPCMTQLFSGEARAETADFGPAVTHADPWVRGIALFLRGAVLDNSGDLAGAERDWRASLTALRPLGERWAMANATSALGELRSLRGDHAGAIAAFEEGLQLAEEVSARDDVAQLRTRVAIERGRAGDRAGARRILARAEQDGGATMTATWTGILVDLVYGDLDRRDGDLAGAEARLKDVFDAIAEPRRMPPQVSAVALLGRARLALARGHHGEAAEAVREAAGWALDGHDMPALSMVADVAADIAARDGDLAGAATLLGASASLRGAPEEGDPDVVALRATLRSRLGAGYEPAYAAGLALPRETVITRLTAGAAITDR